MVIHGIFFTQALNFLIGGQFDFFKKMKLYKIMQTKFGINIPINVHLHCE